MLVRDRRPNTRHAALKTYGAFLKPLDVRKSTRPRRKIPFGYSEALEQILSRVKSAASRKIPFKPGEVRRAGA
jgi:hypothetical protein